MSEELFNGFGMKILLDEAVLQNGKRKKMPRVHRSDVVHVLAFKDEKHILILREYRPFYKEWVWMLPSGHLNEGESSDNAAARELREETGYRAKKLMKICVGRHSEHIDYQNHFYTAYDLIKDPLPMDEDEHLEVHECTVNEALENVNNCKILHLPTAFFLQRFT